MATKTFEDYFISKGAIPGGELIEGDEILILRAGTVFKGGVDAHNALAYMEENILVTDIVTVDVWVPINGTMVEGAHTSSFTFAANQYTYVGDTQLSPLGIKASMSVSKTGPGVKNYAIGVFVNNVQVGTEMIASSEQDAPAFCSTTVTHTLQTNDVIDLRVRCKTDATDCTVSHAQLNIG